MFCRARRYLWLVWRRTIGQPQHNEIGECDGQKEAWTHKSQRARQEEACTSDQKRWCGFLVYRAEVLSESVPRATGNDQQLLVELVEA